MPKRKQPAFPVDHEFYSKLRVPGRTGNQRWLFRLRILEFSAGKYTCRIEESVDEPGFPKPGKPEEAILGKKLRLRKSEITRGTNKTPTLFD